MFHPTEDLRIKWTKVVLPPVFLEEERPVGETATATIFNARLEDLAHSCPAGYAPAGARRPLLHPRHQGRARVCRACSKAPFSEFAADLRIVMRVYFEKPRTTVGWKGLINDPHLDQSYKINDGLRLARHLLLDLAEMGVPTGTEFLDMISPQYIAGLVSWGAIGARTTESQVHRQLVSGISCPVGFKNATSGDVQIAIDAMLSAAHPHTFLGHTKHGQSAIFVTTGQSRLPRDPARRPQDMVNYTAESVAEPPRSWQKAGLPPRIMIDCSHANSSKDYTRQATCLPRRGRADRRGQSQHHRRDDREQSRRRRAEARARASRSSTGRASPTPASHGPRRTSCWVNWPRQCARAVLSRRRYSLESSAASSLYLGIS